MSGFAMFAFVLLSGFGNRRSRRKLRTLLGLTVAIAFLLGAVSCGGGFDNASGLQPNTGQGTPAGSYVAAITYTDSQNNSVLLGTVPIDVIY
jgi:hypothetical protein